MNIPTCTAKTDPHYQVEAEASPSTLSGSASIRPLNGDGTKNGSHGHPSESGADPQDRTPATEVATHFLELPNGAFLELVHSPESATDKLRFLIWPQDATSVVDRFERDGRVYVPPKLPASVGKSLNLRFPREVKACPQPPELYDEICGLVRSYVDLPEASICLVAAFAVSTWFVDKVAVAPYLCISGPPGSGKTTLLRLLHCLCRRAVLIGGNIPSALFSLPASLHPTLLLDELRFSGAQHSQTLECWLRAGNARGVPVTIGGQLVDGFGAKVLCSRQPGSDTALASRALHISLVPSSKTLQVLDDAAMERIAGDFQSRLLMFRLLHHREFVPPTTDLSLFSPRMRDLVRALMPPLGDGNNAVYRQLWHALVDQECNARVDRAHEPEALVTIALFSCCHEEGAEAILVGQIAARVNGNRKRLGEEADLKARAIGAVLKSLGFITDKLDSYGRGLRLTPTVKRRVHDLLRSYGLKPHDPRTDGCAFCKETFPTDDPAPVVSSRNKQTKAQPKRTYERYAHCRSD